MIVIEFDLYAQKWVKTESIHKCTEYFKTKAEVLATVDLKGATTIVVHDQRFAHHPVMKDKFISRAGAETFYQMYVERTVYPVSFDGYVKLALDTDFD